jgi:hypothetical protein
VRGELDPRTSVGVRTGRYLYVHNTGRIREIYDLWNDPNQWKNLAVNDRWMHTHRRIVAALGSAWAAAADCAGVEECDKPLPGILQVDAATSRQRTIRWHEAIDRTYRG